MLERLHDRHPALWSPRRASWWVGVLFAIGSACFFVGPFPGFVDLVGSSADGVVFFVGSIFFTSAALLQLLGSRRYTADWWASLIQFAGTIYFNVDTFRAMQDELRHGRRRPASSGARRRSGRSASWSPASSPTARSAHLRGTREWKIAVVNLAGCVLFGISTVGGYVLPSTGDALDLSPRTPAPRSAPCAF